MRAKGCGGVIDTVILNVCVCMCAFKYVQDYNGVMDNIMQQLLSRELMYDPIKQVSRPAYANSGTAAKCWRFIRTQPNNQIPPDSALLLLVW